MSSPLSHEAVEPPTHNYVEPAAGVGEELFEGWPTFPRAADASIDCSTAIQSLVSTDAWA